MKNRRIFEYFLVAMAIGLGVPIFALLGARDGEREAAFAYPKTEEAVPAAPAAKDYKAMVLASPDAVEKGKSLFQVNCVACHGALADGKGAAAAALTPPPRNFLDPKAKWTRGREPLNIYESISSGSPGTAMPPYAISLSVSDRWALVHYIGSLPGVKDQFKPMDEIAAAAWKP